MPDPAPQEVTVPARRLRCPRCDAAPTSLCEHVVAYTYFDYADGARSVEGYHEVGDIYMVRAICACGHCWRLRGVCQITDLDLPKEK
jgi:hypothetical protein